MKMNLRNRILLPTVALVAVTTLALSATSYWTSRSTMDGQLAQTCSDGVRQVENWIVGQRTNLEQWAIASQMVAALGDSPATPRALVSAELHHAEKIHGCYEDLHLVNPAGLVVASSNDASIGQLDVSDRQYFKDAT